MNTSSTPANGFDFTAIRAANPIDDVVGRFIELRRRGGELIGLCPFHNDKSPSFSVVPRKQKAFCNACAWHGDVIDFVATFDGTDLAAAARKLDDRNLPVERPAPRQLPPDEAEEWVAILPAPGHAPAYNPARTYNPRRGKHVDWSRSVTRCDAYRDADGQVLGYVVRMEIDGNKLTPTVVYARHQDGREAWVSGRFPSPRPLQGLDALAARPDAAVLVVSGEKCREAAQGALAGFVAVTWPGGDGSVLKADWSPLAGRRVTLWPDNDPSGVEAMETLAAALHGQAAEVRFITPSDQRKGWDVADAVADGMDKAAIVAWVGPRIAVWSPAAPDSPPPGGRGEPHKNQHVVDSFETVTGHLAAADYDPDMGNPMSAYEAPPLPDYLPDYAAEYEADYRPDYSPVQVAEAVDQLPATPSPAVAGIPTSARTRADLDATVDPTRDDVPAKYSEDNIALAFSHLYADDLRYVHPWERWLRWEGSRWVMEETLGAFDMVRKVCRAAGNAAMNDPELTVKQIDAIRTRMGLASVTAAVERMAKTDRRHASTVAQWDADLWALNTPAGVVDLRTGSIRQGDRDAHMTKITHASPGGACPAWMRFLEVATAGDYELIRFLQRMCGYALTGSTRDHALFFVYGSGGNGKGTFLNTFQWIIGDYAKSAPADMFTERKHEAHLTEQARLMGARLVTAQETEEGKRWAEAKIKALTGGDPVTANFMRKDHFEYIPQFKLVMTGNHKPGLRNVDEAIKRRLHLIPFTVSIPAAERDPKLAEKLRAEAGGILQWAIEGCLEWQRIGLSAPAVVVAATDEYLEQQDVLGQWLADTCDLQNGFSARSSALYKSFKGWAEAAGEYVLPQKRWAAAMETRGLLSTRTSAGMVYMGIGIRTESNETAW